MQSVFVDAGEVAEMLGLGDRNAFLRRRPDLEDLHGFPLPMPFGRRTLRWRATQIRAWISDHGLPAEAAA